MSKPIRIIVADQHPAVRQGVISALGRFRDLRVIGQAADGRELVKLVDKLKPDVLITDIALPLTNGLEAARQITARHAGTAILILSALHQPHNIEYAIRVGVRGFLTKNSSTETICEAVRAVHERKNYFSPSIARHVKDNSQSPGYAKSDPGGLTPREIQVIQLIAERYTNKEIAILLAISEGTAARHVEKLMEKTGIHNRVGLAQFAVNADISQGK